MDCGVYGGGSKALIGAGDFSHVQLSRLSCNELGCEVQDKVLVMKMERLTECRLFARDALFGGSRPALRGSVFFWIGIKEPHSSRTNQAVKME